MNILVTGGIGFIGHVVVTKLYNAGHKITIIDNETDYNSLPPREVMFLISERKTVMPRIYNYTNDVGFEGEAVSRIVKENKIELIIHLASFPRQAVVESRPYLARETMVQGTINICEAAKKHNVKKVVFVSSSMVYGDFADNTTENAECSPNTLYGIYKLAGEGIIKNYQKYFEYTIVRPSAVYGPRDSMDRVVNKFIIKAMGNQTLIVKGQSEKLDFTELYDAADGIINAALNNNTCNKTYNITRGRSRTLLEAAEIAIAVARQGRIEIASRDITFPSRGMLNIDKARNDFGFNPTTDIENGFKWCYQYLLDSSIWRSKTVY